jgi:hypothetical protein
MKKKTTFLRTNKPLADCVPLLGLGGSQAEDTLDCGLEFIVSAFGEAMGGIIKLSLGL